MNRTRLVPLVLLSLVIVLAPACVKRSISVRSDPPGALVYIDGLEVGKTPVDHIPFRFYGTREIALYRTGYLAERRVVEIDTPWFSTFPVDIFTELVIPCEFEDRRSYYFALKRTERPERATVVRHAHETREEGRARIASARREADYKPRQYVVEDAEKPFVLWGWMLMPPRGEPVYLDEGPPPDDAKDKDKNKKDK